MTHKEHDGHIWVEDNIFTGSGHYILPSDSEDKPFHITRYCPKCKKKREFEYESNPYDKRYHCIICDTVIDMRLRKNKLQMKGFKEVINMEYCAKCGKPIRAIYRENKSGKPVCNSCWKKVKLNTSVFKR